MEAKRQTASERARQLFENRKDRYLSKAELAAYFSVTVRSIERYMVDGLPSLIVGGRRRINLAEALEWFRQRGT